MVTTTQFCSRTRSDIKLRFKKLNRTPLLTNTHAHTHTASVPLMCCCVPHVLLGVADWQQGPMVEPGCALHHRCSPRLPRRFKPNVDRLVRICVCGGGRRAAFLHLFFSIYPCPDPLVHICKWGDDDSTLALQKGHWSRSVRFSFSLA